MFQYVLGAGVASGCKYGRRTTYDLVGLGELAGVSGAAHRRERSWNGCDEIWRRWSREVRRQQPRILRPRIAGAIVGKRSREASCVLPPQ
eukprot:6186524-Pleurochrysis_carterae.AAC.1